MKKMVIKIARRWFDARERVIDDGGDEEGKRSCTKGWR